MRKHRQCPKCKSKKGFEFDYTVHGHGTVQMNFKGKELDHDRHVWDDTGDWAICLNCGGHIEAEKLQLD